MASPSRAPLRPQSVEMHRIFQRDLCKLRLTTARAYVKTITSGGSALASLSGANVRLSAAVQGLGPAFKIKLDLTVRRRRCPFCPCCPSLPDPPPVRAQNVGSTSLGDVSVVFSFDSALYAMPRASDALPILLPVRRRRCRAATSMEGIVATACTPAPLPLPSVHPLPRRVPHHLRRRDGRRGRRALSRVPREEVRGAYAEGEDEGGCERRCAAAARPTAGHAPPPPPYAAPSRSSRPTSQCRSQSPCRGRRASWPALRTGAVLYGTEHSNHELRIR